MYGGIANWVAGRDLEIKRSRLGIKFFFDFLEDSQKSGFFTSVVIITRAQSALALGW